MKNRNLQHRDHWQTPPDFYDHLNKYYNFDYDPVPLHTNFDCLELKKWGRINYLNVPYSLKAKEAIIIDAIWRSKAEKSVMVCLLPVSTSTKLWHDHIKPNIAAKTELRGRLKFIGINDKEQLVNHPDFNKHEMIMFEGEPIPKYVNNSGQHDSMICVFDGRSYASKLIYPLASIEMVVNLYNA